MRAFSEALLANLVEHVTLCQPVVMWRYFPPNDWIPKACLEFLSAQRTPAGLTS